jgi:AcrR family transcriptional regulator
MAKINRKAEIIKAAAILFKEKGYSAVTMRDLADSLGIKASSLYNHIHSKQEILELLVISLAEDFTNGMKEIMNLPVSASEKLRKAIEFHIDITIHNSEALAALNNDWMHLEDKLTYFLKMRDDYEQNFRTIIETGMKTGEFEKRNVEIVLFSLLSTLRNLYLWYARKGRVSEDTLKNNMADTLLKGIFNQ